AVLESSRWLHITITVTELDLMRGKASALVAFIVRGVHHAERVSFDVNRNPNSITINGQLSLSQANLGLEPFSALGGRLQVSDAVEIHFRLIAEPTLMAHHISTLGTVAVQGSR
ncbi:MAG: hypothetical protein ACE1Y4_15545, partial [Lysobacterales bacterium]